MASVTVASVPVVVSEVPVVSGDVLRDTKTSAVSPPIDPLSNRALNNIATTSTSKARRPSAGATFAEAVGIDLNAIGIAEARKIMSVEHKVLGFRPPPGSLAAEAQAAAAKHPEIPDEAKKPAQEKLKNAAREDAQRILAERTMATDGSPKFTELDTNDLVAQARVGSDVAQVVDLRNISTADARRLMSHEHRALGFRPPPGSLAAEAQTAAAKHLEAASGRKEKARKRRGSNDARTRKLNGSGPNEKGGVSERRGSSESSSDAVRQNPKIATKVGDAEKGAKGSDTKADEKVGGRPQTSLSEEALREAAATDAERIKATRGVNSRTATEHAHIDVCELDSAKSAITATAQKGTTEEVEAVVAEEKENAEEDSGEDERRGGGLTMERSETTESVVIIGDVMG